MVQMAGSEEEEYEESRRISTAFRLLTSGRLNLAVCVPEEASCELLLYKKGKHEPEYVIEMLAEDGIGEVRFLALEDLDAAEYSTITE